MELSHANVLVYVCVGLRPKYSILVAVFGSTVYMYIHWYFVDVTSDPAIYIIAAKFFLIWWWQSVF